jgi:N-acetylmuramoyl-L-alanine amidase
MRKYVYIVIFLLSLSHIQADKTFTVVIDPGHGGRDPGCVGSISKEKAINLSVAKLLGNLIERNHKDVNIIYTRKTDVFIPLDERANIANRNKADLFISIHVNSIKRGNASGTETYTIGLANSDENLEVAMRENSVIYMEDDYLRKDEDYAPKSTESYIAFECMQSKHMEQSVSLASEVQKSFAKSKRQNRGVRQAGLLVLRRTSMPSVLIELGFISNRTEERFLASKDGQNTLAKSIYEAFTNFKKDLNRKSGNIGDVQAIASPKLNSPSSAVAADKKKIDKPTAQASKKEVEPVYKIQIFTSDRLLSGNDKSFKGYKEISHYMDNGLYKYTYGSTTDYKKITEMHKKASKDFKGAFIITMKDGKRINK